MQNRIEMPNWQNIRKDVMESFFEKQLMFTDEWKKFEKRLANPVYKSWDKIRFVSNLPHGLNKEEAYATLTSMRTAQAVKTPIQDQNKRLFVWEELSRFRFFFDDFAKSFGVYKMYDELSIEKQDLRRKKIFEGAVEEAIASSQIEGAVITRREGKKLLESKREPLTLAEKMVVNNYKAILQIETEWKHQRMSQSLLLEMQQVLTNNTLEDPRQVGRFRTDADEIVVADKIKDEVAFVPPNQKLMQKQLQNFIDFANDELETDEYFSDVPKAILLHFWLAFLHPFCDGNGRTARALFYWYLLRKNYLYIGFLPISTRIRKSKIAYEKAFMLSEQDGNNLTYFVDYIVRQMQLSMKDFEEYESNLLREQSQERDLAKKFEHLNKRQLELIRFFIDHPDDKTTFRRHQLYQHITYVTARKDILELEAAGFLNSDKTSKTITFTPTKKLLRVSGSL
jgi:Fic family protein